MGGGGNLLSSPLAERKADAGSAIEVEEEKDEPQQRKEELQRKSRPK